MAERSTDEIKKPSFEEVVAVTIMNLSDVGLSFNAQKVGPMNFHGLRNADYGKGFRMPTVPELVPLVYASLENKDYASAKNVVKILRDWLTGDTVVHYFPEGVFVEDNPKIKDNGIVTPNYKALESKLGNSEEKGVIFSDDGKIRFTPYGFKKEYQSALDLSKNSGVIALVNGEENAEKLARASEHCLGQPCFLALSKVDSPKTRVAVLYSYGFDYWLSVSVNNSGDFGSGYSFGVRKS